MAIDSRILLIRERLENDLALGESDFREFKSALEGPERKRRRKVALVARDIGEALVAFANADGGTLIVGAEDDGTVSGIDYAEDAVAVLRNAPTTHVHPDTPLPGVRSHLVTIDSKTVLAFQVTKGTRHVHLTSDGRCLQRKDVRTVPVSSEGIRFERHEQLSREYDHRWVDGASISDLNHVVLARVAETVAPGLSPEKCLQSLGLADFADGALRLRTAALLLFASDVGKWHPRCEVRVLQVAGTELGTGADYNVARDESFSGNVLRLLSEGWEQVRPLLVQKRLAGGTFEFQSAYPEDACREAFVNAVAHRDYSIEGRSIEILVFNDRLEIRNPGRLLSTVTLAELKRGSGVHDSRNTYVARVLRELGYIQEMGEGIRRISDLMSGHELAPPEIDSGDHSFSITFSQRNVFDAAELRWLGAFEEFDLSREEKLIVLLGRGGKLISPSQIWETLGIVDTEDYRQILERLQTNGLLSSQITRNAAATAARRQGIGPRDVPRFAIRTPDLAQRDRREVVDALIALGPVERIGNPHCERVSNKVSAQNVYGNAVRVRQLLGWLGLVEMGGQPSERLLRTWEDAGNPQRGTGADATKRPPAVSLAPVKDIYVGNLDYGATEQELRSLFETVGRVESVTIPKDYLTGESRGYAFVCMSDRETSRQALDEVDGRRLGNLQVRLGWSFR